MIPVTIVFHDDNYGVTTALWETYYRYYYKDGQYGGKDTAGNPTTPSTQRAFNRGQHTKEQSLIKTQFGLDNKIHCKLFYKHTNLSNCKKNLYLLYTWLIPLIQQWQHDTLNNPRK